MKKLSWDEIERMVNEVAVRIKTDGYSPDYLIGITTGGLIPLYFLARRLDNNRNILTISANSYKGDKQGELKILYLPQVDLSDKRVLLVDDLVGTGETLKEVSRLLREQYKVKELKTVTLVASKDSKFYPDWYGSEMAEDWVVFPWDRAEFPEQF